MSIDKGTIYLSIAIEAALFLVGSFSFVTTLDVLAWGVVGRSIPFAENAYTCWVMAIGFAAGRFL